jgi:hypothetical protein
MRRISLVVPQRTTTTYLLLCLVARARPFGDDVLLGLGVGSKGECDTGEGGALWSWNQLLPHVLPEACCVALTKSIPTISCAFERPSPATSDKTPGLLYVAGGPCPGTGAPGGGPP